MPLGHVEHGPQAIYTQAVDPPPEEPRLLENLDVWLNRAAQGLEPLAQVASTFALLSESDQRHAIRRAGLLALQAGPSAEDSIAAVAASGVKPARTAAVLLVRGTLDAQIAKIAALPPTELRDGILLSIALLAIADGRRRATACAAGCSHWWHQDLRADAVLTGSEDSNAR